METNTKHNFAFADPAVPTMSLPEGYKFRSPNIGDLEKHTEVLKVLTTVGTIEPDQYAELLKHWLNNPDVYFPRVIVDEQDQVVATGMVFIERKLIHSCGKVGHIEDIAVALNQQGKSLGLLLIDELSRIGEAEGCYKVILDCSEQNVGFYEKCQYKNSGVFMSRRYD